MNDKKPAVFVIMPFSSEFTSIFDDLIRPSFEEVGYVVKRADSDLDQRNILRKIIHGIAEADLIVAEITTPNANVMYELGLCHGINKPVVLIAQSMEHIPFDLRSYTIILYEIHFAKVGKLKADLKKVGEEHIKHSVSFGNPVADFAPHLHNWTEPEILSTETITATVSVESNDSEDDGLIDIAFKRDAAISLMGELLNKMAIEIDNLGTITQQYTEKFKDVHANPSLGSTAQAYYLCVSFSKELNKNSDLMEAMIPELGSAVQSAVYGMESTLPGSHPLLEYDSKQLLTSYQSLVGLRVASEENLKNIRNYSETVKGLAELRLNKEMGTACRRNGKILDELVAVLQMVESSAIRGVNLLEERLSAKDAISNQ